jgi:dolichyl-phosphate beta-glucosyltransferase
MSGVQPARPRCCVVIPCFNEARRLPREAVLELAGEPSVTVLLVDDGSTDGTWDVLQGLERVHPDVSAMRLEANGGKGEAIRAGLRAALADHEVVGYLDADMATPPAEMVRLLDVLGSGTFAVALASRINLLGVDIARRPARHYLGRIFATCASLALKLRVYDTQCGAKALRRSAALTHALEHPFRSRWAFDVELLQRLLTAPEPVAAGEMVEMPLRTWVDRSGSSVRPLGGLQAFAELGRIALRARRGAGRMS